MDSNKKPRYITVFGKGGIGKSTICSHLAVNLAGKGYKVLQIGCDPKHDSHLILTQGQSITTVMQCYEDNGYKQLSVDQFKSLIYHSTNDVDVIEAGGPAPGQGCAGIAISMVLDLLENLNFAEKLYDIFLFDVLGDVVCGGFAAPIRSGEDTDVILVSSPEYLSLYAVNNIVQGINNLSAISNATILGLVVNKVFNEESMELIHKYAAHTDVTIIGALGFSEQLICNAPQLIVEKDFLIQIENISQAICNVEIVKKNVKALSDVELQALFKVG